MAQLSKREQLLKVAVELFSKDGFHAVGIDAISKKAGVTKKTLYHHFKSKEELILAVLRYYDERFRNAFMHSVESRTEDPVERLLVLFDVAGDWFSQKSFYGCIFVGAMAEFPEEGTPVRNICRESKLLMQDYIERLARKAQMESPKTLAEQLLLLLEGAITMAQVYNAPDSAAKAKKAAELLINNSPVLHS